MKIRFLTGLLLAGALIAQAAETPEYRLPAGVVPVSQVIELRLDPSRPDYSGRTRIELAVDRPVERIGIHQLGLELSKIELGDGAGTRELSASDGDWQMNWLGDGETIQPGAYTLAIEFSGKHATDALGMHRSSFEGNDYIFTQMESLYARRAFPVFDEPSFKIPYQLVITAPEGNVVVSNTPVESRSVDDGWQRVTFMQSPPLPSYLIAYAVGPLDRAEIKGLSVPANVYVPKGYADQLGFVLRETPTIVGGLENYFGMKYPYRKLDFLAVPEFAFGAMENPGLITFRTDLLMVGDDVSGTQAVNVLNVVAHEVAHIWYGDVVTMAWWNDLWLNEAFATWMANHILEDLYPQYESELNLPQDDAFAADELTTSKAIRRTVRNEEEINDGIGLNYTKGHSLLRMLERYVGADVWRRAVRKYIDRYAWSNATERDLWAVVTEESGIDIGRIAGDYLNQPGFASVTVGKDGTVTQQRYARQGRDVKEYIWHIPLNVKYKADGEVRQTYMLLDGATGSLDVPSDADWIFPDAGGNGYYRWAVSLDQFYNLIDDVDALSDREKIALLDNSEALLNSGGISMADYLYVLDRLIDEPHPLVFLPTLEKIKLVGEEFVTPETRDRFARFIDLSLAARFREVGATSQPGDSEAIIQMRPRLMRTFGQFGSDESVREAAARLTDKYLAAADSVQSQLALEAMRVTALNDDGGRYDDYIAAYRASRSADQKSNILAAIYFRDPAVVRRHLDFSLTDAVQAGDSLSGLSFFAYVLDDHKVLYDWLGEHLDELIAKAPGYYQPVLPQVVGDTCNEKNLAMLKEFFADRGEIYASSLAKAVESAEGCIFRKKAHSREFEQFLAQVAANGDRRDTD